MSEARNPKTRRADGRPGRRARRGRRASLAMLAHRTNDLFVELAKLSARLERLENALLEVRDECAKLVQRRLRRLLEQRRESRGRRSRGSGTPQLSLVA